MTVDLTPVFSLNDEVVYALQPKQLIALRATPLLGGTATHIGYGGAAGAAKSHLARSVAAVAAVKWPGSNCGIFRRTYPELRENHIVPFRAEVPDHDGRSYVYKAQDRVVEWANGSRTIFGYLARDEDVFQYQGWEFDVLIFEEATHYSWYQVQWLTGNRLRSSVKGSVPFALYPTNPGNRGHYWFKRLFIDRNFRSDLNENPDEYTFVQAKLTDNAILMERDPKYMERLNKLPEPLRSQLRDGDWTAGAGLALGDLRREQHVVPSFEPMEHWHYWGAYDWGFNHPFSFGLFCSDEDGNAYLIDSCRGRHLHDRQQAERIKDSIPLVSRARYVFAGHDAWNDYKARVENTPTTAEVFKGEGITLSKANISRISGLRNMRHYVMWSEEVPSRFKIMDTPNNRLVFEQLEGMVTDPDRIEDALKVDADEFGEGGDDDFDMVRYGLAARPIKVKEPKPEDVKGPNVDVKFQKVWDRLKRQHDPKQRRRLG